MQTLKNLILDLETFAATNDKKRLKETVLSIVELLPKQPGTIETTLARKALKSLRQYREFDHIRLLANAFINDGCQDPEILRQLAQSMIENGETVPALAVLEQAISNTSDDVSEWLELKGGVGRAWKDQAVRTRASRPEVSFHATRKAFESYKEAFAGDPTKFYQGINMVALAGWDRTHGEQALSAAELKDADDANDGILDYLKKIPRTKLDNWHKATIGEALVAKNDLMEAGEWYGELANDESTDAFTLNSAVRQLDELWNLSDKPGGIELLTPLRAALAQKRGGKFNVSPPELAQMAEVNKEAYQRVLGTVGTATFSWMQKGFKLARSVVLIKKNGSGFGTGYVVMGRDLDERLGDVMYILTNSHVVSDPKLDAKSATPDEVQIKFEVLAREGHQQEYDVASVIWQSPPEEHDASILKIEPQVPDAIEPVQFSKSLPELNGEQRLFIIGHPGGGEISFSFEDNLLLDYETRHITDLDDYSACRIHYRTPTEKGSSGSPIFNANWKTIGLHHSGSEEMQMLNGKQGVYPANEGIWIETIKRALARELDLNL